MGHTAERINQSRLASDLNSIHNIEKARRDNPRHWLYNGEVFDRMLDEALEGMAAGPGCWSGDVHNDDACIIGCQP